MVGFGLGGRLTWIASFASEVGKFLMTSEAFLTSEAR